MADTDLFDILDSKEKNQSGRFGITMAIYLGLDQGGTKTAAAVCDETGNILGSARGAGLIAPYFQDAEGCYLRNLLDTASQALQQAQLAGEKITAICACLNGADWDFEYEILRQKVAETFSVADVIVLNDCVGAMRAGSAKKECAVVCAGTGLNVAVRRRDGSMVVYGYYIREEDQGATALGKSAFFAVTDAEMGLCPPTGLREMLLKQTGYPTVQALFQDVTMGRYGISFKELAPLVTQGYEKGDAICQSILSGFATRVARYVVAGMRRLGCLDAELDVVYSGGVLKGNGSILEALITQEIKKEAPQIHAVLAKWEPVCGALFTLLDRQYPNGLPEQITENAAASAKKMGLLR